MQCVWNTNITLVQGPKGILEILLYNISLLVYINITIIVNIQQVNNKHSNARHLFTILYVYV